MPIVKTVDMLKNAKEGRYAVGAFNICGLDQPGKLIQTAEKLKAPIIMVVPGIIEPYVPFDEFVAVTSIAANRANVPVSIHLSHGGDLAQTERAIKAGFTSVMYDGSKLPYEENVRNTAEAVRMGHAVGCGVEGELGALGSSFVNVSESMTDPQMSLDYVKKTNVDILAVAIGNAHGFYKGKPLIDLERLIAIRNAIQSTNCYLTLHGGTGIPEATVKRCIEEGIVKICIYTEMCSVGKNNAIKYCEANQGYKGNTDIPELIGSISKGFQDAAAECIGIFGSICKGYGSYDCVKTPDYKNAPVNTTKPVTAPQPQAGAFWNQNV